MRTRPTLGAALFVAATALLAGCAQPGQLGHPDAAPGAGPTSAEAPESPGTPETPGAPTAPGAPAAPGAPGPPADPDAPTAAALPGVPAAPVAQAGSDARGTVDRPVGIDTPGPADFLVRTEVLQPGQAAGWIRHPGTVLSAVRSGSVTVQRAGQCAPETFGPGTAFFLGDGEPNELRNDGPEPVVLTRSELLAPGAPEREPVTPAC